MSLNQVTTTDTDQDHQVHPHHPMMEVIEEIGRIFQDTVKQDTVVLVDKELGDPSVLGVMKETTLNRLAYAKEFDDNSYGVSPRLQI